MSILRSSTEAKIDTQGGFVFLKVLGLEPRTLCLKDKYSTIELYFLYNYTFKNNKRVYIGIEYIPYLLINKDLIKL